MGLFNHFPYTNFHELNLDWILNKLKGIEEIKGIPEGGTTGQALCKKTDDDYDVEWKTVEGGGGDVPENRLIPSGGAENYALCKRSGSSYDVYWKNVITPENRLIPEGGTTSQVLTKTGALDYQFEWRTPSTPVTELGYPVERFNLTNPVSIIYAAEPNKTFIVKTSAAVTDFSFTPAGGSFETLTRDEEWVIIWMPESNISGGLGINILGTNFSSVKYAGDSTANVSGHILEITIKNNNGVASIVCKDWSL